MNFSIFGLNRTNTAKQEGVVPSKIYTCWVCGNSYESPVDFLAHLKEMHGSD